MNTGPTLIITKNLPPDKGGMERLWHEAITGISSSKELIVIAPRKARKYVDGHCKFVPTPNNTTLFTLLSFVLAAYCAVRYRPSFVIAASGLTAPQSLLVKTITSCHSVCYLHGLDITYPSRIYQKIFFSSAIRHQTLITNSQNTKNIIVSKKKHNNIIVITPGTNLPVLEDSLPNDKFNVIFFGRIIERKGLSKFLAHSAPSIIKSVPNTVFHIVGSSPTTTEGNELQQCHAIINKLKINKNVKMWGSVSDDELSSLLDQADAHIFPLIDIPGDVEGFGMVALEAASYGTPTFAFSCGGVSDAIEHDKSGMLIPPNDYSMMSQKIIEHYNRPTLTKQSCLSFAEKNTWEHFCKKLNSVLTPSN